MNAYDLSRAFWDFSFENPEKIKPNHAALFFFIIEHCNRLGWKEKFGLPTMMAKEAIGIKNYKTYISTLTDLIDFGFIKLIEKSKNQHSSNIVALVKIDKASASALTKAIIKHVSKQVQNTSESIDSIDKPITIKPIDNSIFFNEAIISDIWIDSVCMQSKKNKAIVKDKLKEYCVYLISTEDQKKNHKDFRSHFTRWLVNQQQKYIPQGGSPI